MQKRIIIVALGIVLVCAGAFFVLTMPRPLQADALPDHRPDLSNGERMFWAGGCASCHAAKGSEGDELLLMVGGFEMHTPFGTFRVPNISPDPDYGIGAWTQLDFINSMVKGVSPDGRHYYPAFPYPYYQNMRTEDLIDLKAFLNTLPSVNNQVADHDLQFPFNIRRGLGLWKLAYLGGSTPPSQSGEEIDKMTPVERGRYLVQGPGHCGACHTPRDAFGGEISERFLAGAESLESSGDAKAEWIPNITPHKDGIGDWKESDIAYSLESGFDPDFDVFGGTMAAVQKNMAKLPAEDRLAIAAYLKSIPAIPSEQP
jgi:mono/diheme cytochrome c family protein